MVPGAGSSIGEWCRGGSGNDISNIFKFSTSSTFNSIPTATLATTAWLGGVRRLQSEADSSSKGPHWPILAPDSCSPAADLQLRIRSNVTKQQAPATGTLSSPFNRNRNNSNSRYSNLDIN